MDYTIRRATIEDLDSIVLLWKKLSLQQIERDPYHPGEIEFTHENEQFKEALTHDGCAIFVSESESKIFGFIEIWYYEKDFYFQIDSYAYIMHCFIEPDYRKSFRLINDLLKAVEKWAVNKGVRYVGADVYEHNKKVAEVLGYFNFKGYRTRLMKQVKQAE